MIKIKKRSDYLKLCIKTSITELLSMKIVFIMGNILVFTVATISCIFYFFDFKYFTGIIAGNILSIAYFISIGYSGGLLLSKKHKNIRKAEIFANTAYGIRYISLFAICCLLLHFRTVSIFYLVTPLFFPKIHYFFTAFKKTKKNFYPTEETKEYSGGKW